MAEVMALLLFIGICVFLMSGYPVAFVLGGVSLLFAGVGVLIGIFDGTYLSALPNRIYGIMNNQTMLAVPLFVFMGVMLEKSRDRKSTRLNSSHVKISYAVFFLKKTTIIIAYAVQAGETKMI